MRKEGGNRTATGLISGCSSMCHLVYTKVRTFLGDVVEQRHNRRITFQYESFKLKGDCYPCCLQQELYQSLVKSPEGQGGWMIFCPESFGRQQLDLKRCLELECHR